MRQSLGAHIGFKNEIPKWIDATDKSDELLFLFILNKLC